MNSKTPRAGGHRGLDVVEADAQDPAACERIRAAKGYPTSGAIVPARTLEQSQF